MANLTMKIYNIKFIFIILNIIILLHKLSAAPTLISTNLTDPTNNNEKIPIESSTIISSLNDEFKLIASTTELPRFNRTNITKPMPLQKSKKLTKNLNGKKLKEKNLKYSINNGGKQQVNNYLLKNQIEGFTTTTIITTEIESLPTTESTLDGKLFTENNNHSFRTSEILNTLPLSTHSSITTITPIMTNNSNISNLSKLDKSEVNNVKNYQTTFIPVQITSRNENDVESSTIFTTTTSPELIMSTAIIVPTKDNEKILQDDGMENSTPLTMNINIHQGHDKKEDIFLTNNSIVSTEIGKNDYVSSSTVNVDEEITSTTLNSLSNKTTHQSDSFVTVTSSQIELSEKDISELTTENQKDKRINLSTVKSILESTNIKMATDTGNLNNTEKVSNLDSIPIKLINLNSEMSTESTTTSIYIEDITNSPNIIQNFTITNTTNQFNNKSGVNLMGHDGVKVTKKKQLIEKHFKDDEFIKESLDKINIHKDSKNSGENMKNMKMGSSNKLDVTQNTLGSTDMKEEIQTTPSVDENNHNDKNMTSTITKYLEIATTTDGNNIEFTTENKLDTTILLDIDLIPKITTDIESITEIPEIIKTENEFIKHKNFEKSLISKMEWIPIENIDHSLMNTKDYTTTDKLDKLLDTFEQTTTILPIQLTTISELNGYNIKTDLLTNTEFIPITKFQTDLEPKSLEIELIDTQQGLSVIDKMNIKSVPEFFEIPKKHQNEKESESSPIEIQINVSEGFGNETENLEFSFRQPQQQQQQQQKLKQKHIGHLPPPGFQEIGEITIQRTPDLNTLQPIPLINDYKLKKNNNNNNNVKSNNNNNDDILQVEITAIDNTTKVDEKQLENFNDTPKFTVHNEQNGELRENDDFFIPDLKMEPIDENSGSNKNIENLERDSIDQDSDTIFYISNTEVKVVESLPTTNLTNQEFNHIKNGKNNNNNTQDSNRSKLESQFFPTIYEEDVLTDTTNQSKLNKYDNKNKKYQQDEEIILSPIKKFLEPIKVINNNKNYNNNNNNNEEIILNSLEKPSYKSPAAVAAAAAPDVSYVGETYIEIEESTNNPNEKLHKKLIPTLKTMKKDNDFPVIIMDTDMNSSGALLSDVIIQPAVVPEMSIGVPVIGELPPQIELKEIDFVPSLNGINNKDHLTDNNSGSIQYGADLIADEAELNDNPNRYIFESGYPFTDEKISRVGRIQNNNNDDIDILDRDNDNDQDSDDIMATSQQIIMHAVDNLQREQLIADLPLSDSWEGYKDIPIKRNNNNNNNNGKLTNSVGDNSTNFGVNSTGVNGTELLGNATAFSVLEDNDVTEFNLADIQTLIIACLATLVPLILSLLTAFGLRYLWIKYRRDHDEGSGLVGDSSRDPLAAKSVAISQDELQTTESGYTLNRSNDTLESNTDITGRTSGGGGTIIDGVIVNSVGHDGISQSNNIINNNGLRDGNTISTNQQNYGGGGCGNNASIINNKNLSNHCGANGSITTMTLKNNHLIVETEERNDISRDARETKMHYTSSEKDGVFVVEVARGADSTGAPGSPHKELTNNQKSYSIDIDNIEQKQSSQQLQQQQQQDECNHEEVQIHQPPPSSKIDTNVLIEVDESNESPLINSNDKYNKCNNLGNSNTGLSQSDLSSSSDDSNKAYSYGKQELYTINCYSPSSQQPKILSQPHEQLIEYIGNGIDDKKIIEIENNNNNDIKSNKENIETKPFITSALLKQDTLNELNNGKENDKMNFYNENNCNGDAANNKIESKIIKSNDDNNENENSIINGLIDKTKDNHQIDEQNKMNDKKITDLNQEIIENMKEIVIENYENGDTNGIKENEVLSETNLDNNCVNGENGFDSIISLPEPPSTEEIKQMNDIILMENNQLDSLPPPPPPESQQIASTTSPPPITINTNGNSFNNNISPIPESINEDEKLLLDDENCCDDNKTILTLTTSKETEQHQINELQNGIGGGSGGGNNTTTTVVATPLAVTGSS